MGLHRRMNLQVADPFLHCGVYLLQDLTCFTGKSLDFMWIRVNIVRD